MTSSYIIVLIVDTVPIPVNPWNGPMNSNSCTKDLRSCSLNQMHTFHPPTLDTVLGSSLCHCLALFCGKSWQWWWPCALFCDGPHWGSKPALAEISRLWAQADFSEDFFSKPRGVKINLFPPPVMSFFLSLTIRRLVMHIWNWFETHSAACWCGMEREVTTKKFTK